jgi:hypothetical protein
MNDDEIAAAALSREEMRELCATAVVYQWYVRAKNILICARLINLGYATVSDDYEGPQICLTNVGLRIALASKNVIKDDEGSGFTYSLIGRSL